MATTFASVVAKLIFFLCEVCFDLPVGGPGAYSGAWGALWRGPQPRPLSEGHRDRPRRRLQGKEGKERLIEMSPLLAPVFFTSFYEYVAPCRIIKVLRGTRRGLEAYTHYTLHISDNTHIVMWIILMQSLRNTTDWNASTCNSRRMIMIPTENHGYNCSLPFYQCCGSGSEGSVNNWLPGSVSGSLLYSKDIKKFVEKS